PRGRGIARRLRDHARTRLASLEVRLDPLPRDVAQRPCEEAHDLPLRQAACLGPHRGAYYRRTRMIAESEIDDAYARGRRSWPGIEISALQFGGLARELGVEEQGLRTWAEDFYLACAAAHGDERAVEIIDERYVRSLAGRIRRLGAPASAVADVLQAIRERLFTGARPRIRAYNAIG